ncbi:alpha/beta fold hydrolase [Mucilaginibacter sp. CSA2-8R]|uniref:alpha/beta hydrolase n=1 Tax=Mucilaginibacter sp. CSA2-8R TaxID=3141542 RepID=UPI00315D40CF
MKHFYRTLLLLIICKAASAQPITGTWYGILNWQSTQLPIIIHIDKTTDRYTSTWDSPSQGAKGLATLKTNFYGNQLSIDGSNYGVKISGTFMPDSNIIRAEFSQGLANLPLRLQRTPVTAPLRALATRPQEPADIPYRQEDVVFTNAKAGAKLAGTLTLPANGKASKIVVLISGSGPQNRNEELAEFNQRPFLIWSDWLTRQGIAVLRYDDRGVDQSTGDFQTATTADFADDAEAAIRYIQSCPELKSMQIGLLGHSEGGLIAPMIAARNKAVKFLVLLAAPGVPIRELLVKQSADQMRLAGASDLNIQTSSAINRTIYAVFERYPLLSDSSFKRKLTDVVYKQLTGAARGTADTSAKQSEINESVRTIVDPLVTPWYRYFITAEPTKYLTKVTCPVLALNGTLDMQVNNEANLAGIKESLQKAGNTNYTITALPGLNHLMQKAKTGGIAEYGTITETVNQAALVKVSSWIKMLK